MTASTTPFRRTPSRRTPQAIATVVAVLLLTACGSRVSDSLRTAAADAALGRGGGTTGGTGGTSGTSGTTGATTGATTGTTGGRASTGTSGFTTTGGSSTTGATTGAKTTTTTGTVGAPAPAGGNGGATDVGVGANSINLGIVADLSGPIPGLFKGAVLGAQAYLAKINSQGGVFGRQLKLDVGDSQLDCGQYKSVMQDEVGKDFALIGSFSLYDSCGADVLKANPTVSDIHSALSTVAQSVPNNFSVAPLGSGWRTGPLSYYKNKFGDAWQHIGSIYAAVGGGADTWNAASAVIQRAGAPWQGHVSEADSYQPTDTDFTTDIVKMQQSGVKMLYLIATNNAADANILHAVRQQAGSKDWPVVYGGSAYDTAFLQQAQPDLTASGVGPTYEDQQYAMFFNSADAQAIPAVADFQTWYGRVSGGAQPDLFAAYAWSSAQLFVKALTAAGPKALRTSLFSQLKSVTSFDADGLLVKADPAHNKPGNCWIFSQNINGQWVRQDSPAATFRCDGPYATAS